MNLKSDGFTLLELIIVISILGIISVIAIPKLAVFENIVEERVCYANRKTVERMYSKVLFKNDHGDILTSPQQNGYIFL